ncbi:MAG: 16S rRNA (guanine(966)-N(2))-methyltransferase RsmD [bacterium]|nr:16S rRNA (guanine(966)-N(2))-methyltransferase RsmD [bacterium]
MRIVAGRHRRRRLVAPEGTGVRPTADRVREALFNILVNSRSWRGLDGAHVADVFCGTGAIALEALSRGASHAVLVDNAPAALDAASRNIAALGEERRTMLVRCDATRQLPDIPRPVDLAYLDPPWRSRLAGTALENLRSCGWLGSGALAVVEQPKAAALHVPDGFTHIDERIVGRARLVFLRLAVAYTQ